MKNMELDALVYNKAADFKCFKHLKILGIFFLILYVFSEMIHWLIVEMTTQK